jgi:prepilin-type processing-associated H-X9-DG protein
MTITRPNACWLSRRSSPLRRAGFTLLEASAVICIISVLVSLLCAALNSTKNKALRVTCLDNMKQLQAGWMVYIVDNDETLPLNQTAPAPPDPRFPQRRTSEQSWVAGNPLIDVNTDNIRRGSLFDYIGATGVYRCPMDNSTVHKRPDLLRTRSYAMNSYLGGDEELNPKYKFSEIARPDNAFVFIEEHESSAWLSSFIVPPAPTKGRIQAASSAVWLSTPADRHDQGCNISFADGHIEYWRWYAPKQASTALDPQLSSTRPAGLSESRDFIRLQSCLP